MLKNAYRLKFKKLDMMRFTGHLDLLRIMQRSINRSKLPISYSKGFNPHQIISFALPLSLGYGTYGDYFEIELEEDIEPKEIIYLLNSSLPKGLEIINCFKKQKEDGKCAAILTASSYGIYNIEIENLKDRFNEFINQDKIITMKKTKKSEKEVDIKSDILDWSIDDKLSLTLPTGSNKNLKVDLVLKAFYDFNNISFDVDRLSIYRKEMYYDYNEKLIPLEVGVL